MTSQKKTGDPATPVTGGGKGGRSKNARHLKPHGGLIVGIGASAGGLEAFKAFFAHMPADSELAFVLVQHLAPDHESLLAELLSHVTSMPVLDAVNGARVEPRHVYVIPPNATLTIVEGILQVRRPAPPREQRWRINTFFTSLAQDQGDRAVCVVLAGTGSDGSQGLRAVKEHGGLTSRISINSMRCPQPQGQRMPAHQSSSSSRARIRLRRGKVDGNESPLRS